MIIKDRAMLKNRILAVTTLAVLAGGCAPSIPQNAAPASVTEAVFDSTAGDIPLPNDLALQSLPNAPLNAQVEILQAFAAQGGFPNDQEVAITVSFTRDVPQSDGSIKHEVPDLDFTSFNAGTFFVLAVTAQQSGPAPLEPLSAADYATAPAADGKGQKGVLSIHRQGRVPWDPGHYIMAIRGGANGVKTTSGDPVYPATTFYLIAQGEDLSTEKNIGLLRTQLGSIEAARAAAAQLNQIVAAYKQGPFQAVDQVFPHQELAAMSTFAIAPRVTQVELDPGRGLVPLPIDLLRDPVGGKLTPLAACTLAGGSFNGTACLDKQGSPSAAAAAFATLDGFSTTAAMLAPTSDLIQASTVTSDTVKLYDLSGSTPALVDPTTLIFEPAELQQSGMSTTIALQPAGATSSDSTSVFRTRPLKDNTSYAVIITNGVKDKSGKALGTGTVGKILLFSNALIDANKKSQLPGIDDATAGGLEVMRQQLAPVVAASGFTKADIAMAYTFKTQSFLETAVKLAALPYTQAAATALPGAVTPLTATQAFTKYGVDPAVDQGNIGGVLETTLTSFNLLDPQTGAFNPDPTKAAAETLKVLIVTPKVSNPALQACGSAFGPLATARCAPMVIFRHGFGSGRAAALLVADGLAKEGLVTVAIDAAKHGDRTLCGVGDVFAPGTTVPICSDGAACVALIPAAGNQGDTKAPGTCAAGFTKAPVSRTCALGGCPAASDGIPIISGNFVISGNLFRTRDTFRQDMIDQSQLVRVIAFAPPSNYTAGTNPVFDTLAAGGLVIDPSKVYYVGQSLGAINGAADVATNPRISKAVLNVGGGTITDVFATSPAFSPSVDQLLAGLGIGKGTSAYFQFLIVAKTVLDPADPINYVGHLTGNTLPNLLAPLGGNENGSVPQTAKKVLDQVAFCDQTVPNPFNLVFASNAGTGPLPGLAGFGGPGTFQLFFKGTSAPSAADLGSCPAPGGTSLPAFAVGHSFLTDWVSPSRTRRAQGDAAAFLAADTTPLTLVVLP
jgi:dienelactone hydrolase